MARKRPASELRKDYIQDKYVIIAPRRSDRPHALERPERVSEPPGRSCKFCLTAGPQDNDLCHVGPRSKWRLKVMANKYAAVSVDNPKAYGVQEVIVETPDHLRQLEELPEGSLVELLKTYARRTEELNRNPNIQYVLIFKNNGGRAGASLRHSHSQIFATSFIPPHLLDKSRKAFEYKLQNGSCVYCDVIAREIRGPRLVHKDSHIAVFTPYASMHNYELWILPLRHFDNITDMNRREMKSWASALKRALGAVSRLGLPYNFYFHQVMHDKDQHLYMKITPRGSVWAGVEIGSGIIINPISPEDAARYYRKAFSPGRRR